MIKNYQHTVTERFMRYVQIDTQSDPNSNTYPTTEKQKQLSNLLAEELKQLVCMMRMQMNLVMCMQPFHPIQIKKFR